MRPIVLAALPPWRPPARPWKSGPFRAAI